MFAICALTCQQVTAQGKDAEPATRAANDAFAKSLPFSDRADFDDAKRGFIATLPDGVIAGPGGRPAFDTKRYAFLSKDEVPATVNPSLWRQAQLNAVNGLFKVVERVYQVRGIDIANMTIIEGDTGLILIDPLLVQRDREGCARSVSAEPSGKTGRRCDLQPQPCRSFRRRQGRDVSGGCRQRQGKSDRAGRIHGACGGGEHHRRQCHDAAARNSSSAARSPSASAPRSIPGSARRCRAAPSR